MACAEGNLDETPLLWHSGYSVAVVLASEEYPETCATGKPMNLGTTRWMCDQGITIFQAGTKLNANVLLTAGGRVLAPTSVAPTLAQAVAQANTAAQYIAFDGKQYRTDIGYQGIEFLEKTQQPYNP
jgi:phosphoribosylamine-glycine ligase